MVRGCKDHKGPQVPGSKLKPYGQWGAIEGSKSRNDLLKVSALKKPLAGPQLEAGRLVELSQGPSKRSEASARVREMVMDKA